MNSFKPTLSIEPTNSYDRARQDLIKAMNSVRELTDQEQKMLAEELFGAARVAAIINLFNLIS